MWPSLAASFFRSTRRWRDGDIHTVRSTQVRTRDLFASLPEFRVLQAQECGLAWPRTPVDGDALRTKRWVESGGARVVGEDFLAASPLPARTETEGRYEKDSRPVYRVAGVVCKM